MEGLRSSNEIRQTEAATELAEMLLLGNEESLPALPIKDITHALINLLQKEHNFQLMLMAARCISNMLEALPRSMPIVVDAVPYLLDKLKRIEFIDVAEQSLMALEVISKRNGKNIMTAGGIAATISHVDFFSVSSQRLAFQIAANCATFLMASDFVQVRDSLADLTQRLLIEDKRCLESVCQMFCRLVDNMRNHADKLRELAGQDYPLLKNVQQLLLVQPCAVGPTTFQALIRMLRTMAAKCSDLAVALIRMDFARTIKYLIVGPKEAQGIFDVTIRPAHQLQELVFLAGELLPHLPTDGIFEIDSVILRPPVTAHDAQLVLWFWKDDMHQWQAYNSFESRMIEMAYSTGESEVTLQINNSVYKIDVQERRQVNVATLRARDIRRRVNHGGTKGSASKIAEVDEKDQRLELMRNEPVVMQQLVQMLLPILVEIDASSSGPALRYESLRVMLRMIYPSDVGSIKAILNDLPLSGHIVSALGSQRGKDLCVVACALQLTHLLLDKFHDFYVPLFKREGVAHEIEKLAQMKLESPVISDAKPSEQMSTSSSVSTETITRTRSAMKTRSSGAVLSVAESVPLPSGSSRNRSTTQPSESSSSSADAVSTRAGAAASSSSRQRKKASPESAVPAKNKPSTSKKESKRKTSSANFLHSLRLPSFRMPGNVPPVVGVLGAATTGTSSASNSAHETPSLTSLFNSMGSQASQPPPSYSSIAGLGVINTSHGSNSQARARIASQYVQLNTANLSNALMQSSANAGFFGNSFAVSGSSTIALNHQQKEKLRQWIQKEAEDLTKTYFASPPPGVDGSVLMRMAAVMTALNSTEDVGSAPLTEFKSILLENDVSAFELSHSGVMLSLCKYLTSTSTAIQPSRKIRLKRFASVFMSLHSDNLRPAAESSSWDAFEVLISKLLASLGQNEQFQVKVSDMGGIFTTSTSGALRGIQALRFFQTHQIRCQLRKHPSCKDLKDWRNGHGSLKVDPFTSISAIERYLLDRGVGTLRGEDLSPDSDISEDDEMPSESSFGPEIVQPTRLEILINNEIVPGYMSLLQALRQFANVSVGESSDQVSVVANLWSSTHTLHYRSVHESLSDQNQEETGSTPSKSSSAKCERREKRTKIDEKLWIRGQVPEYECPLDTYLCEKLPVDIDDPCVPSLVLLRCLYGLNRFWWTLFDDEEVPPTSFMPLVANTAFHCAKLNAKIGRQLSDFLSVATQQIPKWVADLIKAVPFILTFSTRRNYMYCTAFGRDRALMHVVNQTDAGHNEGESGRSTPRLERRKVSVRRDDLLRQAEQTMLHLGSSKAMLEVGFEGEAGTGFGPTLEFYSAVSIEVQKASLRLWHGKTTTKIINDAPPTNYVYASNGLYPLVNGYHSAKQRDTRLKKFEFIGRLLAQALIDSRLLDIPFNPVFFKWFSTERKHFGFKDFELFDKDLAHSVREVLRSDADSFENLEQYFTLPGDESFELIKGGKNIRVDSTNVSQFVELVVHWFLVEGVRREMDAVRKGFETVVNPDDLSYFTPEEMEELFCGCSETTWNKTWDEVALQTAIKPDHGYTHDSEQIRWLIQMLASFDNEEQRKFLQFVTGSPKLPVGGFRSLNPPLTVVKKSGSYASKDDELPSAMTCYNYLKVPAYTTYEVFYKRFETALRFIYSFHLT